MWEVSNWSSSASHGKTEIHLPWLTCLHTMKHTSFHAANRTNSLQLRASCPQSKTESLPFIDVMSKKLHAQPLYLHILFLLPTCRARAQEWAPFVCTVLKRLHPAPPCLSQSTRTKVGSSLWTSRDVLREQEMHEIYDAGSCCERWQWHTNACWLLVTCKCFKNDKQPGLARTIYIYI
jgi:hypothetical protein